MQIRFSALSQITQPNVTSKAVQQAFQTLATAVQKVHPPLKDDPYTITLDPWEDPKPKSPLSIIVPDADRFVLGIQSMIGKTPCLTIIHPNITLQSLQPGDTFTKLVRETTAQLTRYYAEHEETDA